jgi:hypothetical protein
MERELEKEWWDIKTDASTREIGKMILEMVKLLNVILMVIRIMDHSIMGKHMVKVFIHGVTEKSMMENGIKDWSMDMESGEVFTMILILGNGDHLKQKDMEFILGKTAIDTKENGNNV